MLGYKTPLATCLQTSAFFSENVSLYHTLDLELYHTEDPTHSYDAPTSNLHQLKITHAACSELAAKGRLLPPQKQVKEKYWFRESQQDFVGPGGCLERNYSTFRLFFIFPGMKGDVTAMPTLPADWTHLQSGHKGLHHLLLL